VNSPGHFPGCRNRAAHLGRRRLGNKPEWAGPAGSTTECARAIPEEWIVRLEPCPRSAVSGSRLSAWIGTGRTPSWRLRRGFPSRESDPGAVAELHAAVAAAIAAATSAAIAAAIFAAIAESHACPMLQPPASHAPQKGSRHANPGRLRCVGRFEIAAKCAANPRTRREQWSATWCNNDRSVFLAKEFPHGSAHRTP